jgi:hypothetical protein
MTRRPPAPFAQRLALARAMIARGAPAPSGHLADQYAAAKREAKGLHDRVGELLPVCQPGRPWFNRADHDPSDEVRAYLLAAVLGCMQDTCCHLRRGGPQPALVLLPQRRVACTRCAATIRRPVTAPDECDVCEARGVTIFSPFACHQGPAIISGDCCQDCAGVLCISLKERAS